MEIDELKVYQKAMGIAEKCWNQIVNWDYLSKDTVGKQLVRAVDSIAANLSEGFGRYHYKEAKNFGYYSRGSLYETLTWLKKALNRKLMKKEDYLFLSNELKDVSVRLNNYIRSIGKSPDNRISEDDVDYFLDQT